MIHKILIANRGEIACRIARTCRDLGIQTVAVYADADADALHVTVADESVHLGGSAASESYLHIERILSAARHTQADAIHPGYGFLAENADFAQAVIDAGLTWIGPPPDAISAMGKKREAKQLLQGIPLVPGYQDEAQDDETLIEAAAEIGYPIMVKASAGGGGKGMRRVDSAEALPDALATARREAQQAFGEATLILEKFVETPRHIEIQIFGDTHGNVIAIGERECSIQRRHQKIIEETPSPVVDQALRERMSAVAVSIGQQLGYTGAGTVEFLLDPAGEFYFMEMNTRLQVEHPVTEIVYGFPDLVALQIAVAEGAELEDIAPVPYGHAIEARIYAEDPARDFLPATGPVVLWRTAEDDALVRVDDGIRTGDTVTINYDPMVAKIISYGDTRAEAIRKLDYALANTILLGLRHNISFLRRVLTHPDHIAGDLNTNFISDHPELFETVDAPPPVVLIALALAKEYPAESWRNNRYRPIQHTFRQGDDTITVHLAPARDGTHIVTINDTEYTARLIDRQGHDMTLVIDGHRQKAVVAHIGDDWWIHTGGRSYHLVWQTPLPLPGLLATAAGSLRAPMPGQVIAVNVQAGESVKQGDVLMTLEAMKMEHRIEAPYDGVVEAIHFAQGDSVQADAALLEIEPQE